MNEKLIINANSNVPLSPKKDLFLKFKKQNTIKEIISIDINSELEKKIKIQNKIIKE